uniref:Uncharacterized protein n=1 Tax=Zea mays TaxID=4577 RepID=C4JC31_MAIZE|nr:unknown [Zea mays]
MSEHTCCMLCQLRRVSTHARMPRMDHTAHLLCEGGGRSHAEGVEERLGGGHAGLVHEHAGVEVERRRRAQLGGRRWPRHLVRALLAVADPVLRGVAPRLLAEAVHHRVEVPLLELEQAVDVLEHLDVRVQVHHPLVLHELHESTRDVSTATEQLWAKEKAKK